MSDTQITDAQKSALKWLRNRNADGVFDKNQVLTAAGERAPVMRSTWSKLEKAGYCERYLNNRRMKVTPVGLSIDLHGVQESRRLGSPDDWALPAKWGQWALSEGWVEADIRFEADRFRDFWCSKAGKDATKIDWEATWRNWIRSAKGRTQQRSQPPPKPKSEFQRKHEEAIAVLTKSLGGNDERDSFHGATIDISAADFRAH